MNRFDTHTLNEYDQEIPQSQNADKPRGIVGKSHTTITRHQEDKQSKATSSLCPNEMIAKKVSEYDQEKSQSQTAGKTVAS